MSEKSFSLMSEKSFSQGKIEFKYVSNDILQTWRGVRTGFATI